MSPTSKPGHFATASATASCTTTWPTWPRPPATSTAPSPNPTLTTPSSTVPATSSSPLLRRRPSQGHHPLLGGPAAIDRYLTLVAHRPPTLGRITNVLRIGIFIASDTAERLSWNDADRTRLAQTSAELVTRPAWRTVVDRALDDPDIRIFRRAIWPSAGELGL